MLVHRWYRPRLTVKALPRFSVRCSALGRVRESHQRPRPEGMVRFSHPTKRDTHEKTALMTITVVCAIVSYAVAEMSRISPEQRQDIEREWVSDPLGTKFLPSEGARVRAGDPLLKVAWIIANP